jgi:V-type H+-transporting ATPase subunit G
MIDSDRTKRVKEAREEAKKEIEAYRKQKEEEFKKFEAEVCKLNFPQGYLDSTMSIRLERNSVDFVHC